MSGRHESTRTFLPAAVGAIMLLAGGTQSLGEPAEPTIRARDGERATLSDRRALGERAERLQREWLADRRNDALREELLSCVVTLCHAMCMHHRNVTHVFRTCSHSSSHCVVSRVPSHLERPLRTHCSMAVCCRAVRSSSTASKMQDANGTVPRTREPWLLGTVPLAS